MPLRRVLLSFALLLLAPIAARAQTPADTLPHPESWDTFYMVFLLDGPRTHDRSAAAGAALRGHIQYQLRLQQDGRAIASGGLGPTDGSDIAGLILMRARSEEEARAFAEADPAVRFGRFRVVVRAWYVPGGRLPRYP